MTDIFTKHMQALHSIFSQDFINAYQDVSPRMRKRILPCLQSVYRRWYYSTLIDNIHFSPANIVSCIGHYCGMTTGTHIVADITQPASKLCEIDFKVLNYSMDDHPIVQDLRCLIEYCMPHIDLGDHWCFTDAQAVKLAKKLTLNDPSYSTFLLEVAYKMELLERMPSLYVQKMQVSENANSILALSNAELFRKIVDTVIELTAIGLQNALPASVAFFSEEGIRNLLFNPISSDQILEQAFGVMGYDLENLLVPEALDMMGEFPEEAEATAEMMSGVFILGVMLDRLFFTPFGYFLRLILPIYSLPFDIKHEINQYFNLACDEDDEFAAFFAPSTTYTLTELGLEFFDVNPTEQNYFDGRTILPPGIVESMSFTLSDSIRIFVQAARDAIPISERPDSIYTFRVQPKEEPNVWVHIQIPKMASLHHLYDEIADVFFIYDYENYSFFHGETENLFAEYSGNIEPENAKKSSINKSKPKKKHTHVPLSMLDFDHTRHMLLIFNNKSVQKFTLEWVSETAREPKEYYPRLSEISEAAQKIFDEYEDLADLELLNIDDSDLF